MQCQSYFPMYHSQYDLNADANGVVTPLCNGNGSFRSGHYNDYVPSLPVPPGQFAYKELLRQTMLRHEVAFKDQVQELHCLYRKQKELMSEIKSKELHMNHLQLEVQSSSSSSATTSARWCQNTLHSLPFINSHNTQSPAGTDTNQMSLVSGNEPRPPTSPVSSRNGATLNSLHFEESKCKRIKGKLLDLELPAEAYLDSDEEGSLEDTEFFKAPTPATLPSNKRCKVVLETCAMASTAKRSLDPVFQGEHFSSCSFSVTKTTLVDLNEPLEMSYLEESSRDKRANPCLEISERIQDLSNSNDTITDGAADKLTIKSLAQSDKAKSEVGSASSGRKPSYNLGQNPLVVQALPSIDNHLFYSKGARFCGRQKGPYNNKVDASSRCIPSFWAMKSLRSICSEPKSRESVICTSAKHPDLNCFDLNSAVVANSEFTPCDKSSTEVLNETETRSKRCRIIDINLPCDSMTDEEPVIQDDKVEHDLEIPGRLNLNIFMDDSGSLKSSSLDIIPSKIDLEAPVSPEMEECPPPRGDSEENQPEEAGDYLVGLAKIAAESIVSISSSKAPIYQESIGFQKCEASESGYLEWFTGLIDSLSIDLENDFETTNCKDPCSVDDFEALTLELSEMKVEEFLCKNNVLMSSETCSLSLPCQTRKGRTRRSKRKDFQKEVLPSLASLSRYEVTEDIQMIEGLMEAAGTPWHLCRTKRACRIGRKPRVAKQQTFVDELPELRTLISWGKVNRRPRGRRSPANPTVLSKWLYYTI